jgi:hypothetical protein
MTSTSERSVVAIFAPNELMRTNAMDGQIFGLLHLGMPTIWIAPLQILA